MKHINVALFVCALLGSGCSGAQGAAQSVALGPDNNYWTVDPHFARVAKLEPSGAAQFFALPDGSDPTAIVAGPDANLWFTEPGRNRIGRITPSGIVKEFMIPSDGANPTGLISSPPDRVWFMESSGKLGTIPTTGTPSEFSVPAPIESISAAPDGAVIAKARNELIHVSVSGAVKVLSIK